MSIADAVLLGVIQGLTEFLPVSSSGHLVLCERFLSDFDASTALIFNVTLHLGTLLSVAVYYWRDLSYILVGLIAPARVRGPESLARADANPLPPDSPDRRYAALIVLATIMTVLVAFPLRNFAESLFTDHEKVRLVGIALIITGLILALSERMRTGGRGRPSLGAWDAIVIGLSQGIAVIPGLSRSGTTIAAGLIRGIDGVAAVRFSFLLSIPIILAAQAYAVVSQSARNGLGAESIALGPYLIGAAAAFISGLVAIRIIVLSVRQRRLYYFAIYCLVLGVAVTLFA